MTLTASWAGDTHALPDHANSVESFESANPRLAGIASGSYTDNLGLIRWTIDPTRQVTSRLDHPGFRGRPVRRGPDTQAIVDSEPT